MKKKYTYLLFLSVVLASCNNSNIISSTNSSSSSISLNSSVISSSSSSFKDSSESSSIINKSNANIDFVISKLQDVLYSSYTLNYYYQGIEYNDIYKYNTYYYNDMSKQGSMLINLYGYNTFLYDFYLDDNEVNITNQSYGSTGTQGQQELNYYNLSLIDFESLENELIEIDEGVKLENSEFIKQFTFAINDANSFDYIIFNEYNGNLTFDFYFQGQLFDGYSYMLKDVGDSSNEIIDNYLNSFTKLEQNASSSKLTFEKENVVINGDISYTNGLNYKNWETIRNTRLANGEEADYELTNTSNGISYRQIYHKNSDGTLNKIGLNGQNELVDTPTYLLEQDIYPLSISYMQDCYLVDNNEYIYLGNDSNGFIYSLIPNMSSIIIDSWIKEIRFIIEDNSIKYFAFNTYEYFLNNEYVKFVGEFNITHDGVIEEVFALRPKEDDTRIKEIMSSLTSDSANYVIESNSYFYEGDELVTAGEKHIINYVNNVYFDGNYRINNDGSLTLQFGNGYTKHNDKIYSFRYDATLNKVDNIKEVKYTSVGEAILSLKEEILVLNEGSITINPIVTDITNNVNMLEQSGLIDPSTVTFSYENDSINQITYKYGNAYTSAYVEANINYGNANINEEIINQLNEELSKSNEIKELYMKDVEDEYVKEIYQYLYDYLLGEKADYIPYVPGIENCLDIIWLSDNPEGYQYLIEDAPSDYLDNFKNALVEIYGYTKVNSNTYTNTNTGLKIELKEDYGYQQFILSII